MNEFLEQFLVECRELVEQATDDLLALEERPDDREHLDSAFRAFHTLKGAAGIVDFAAMESALHAAESVLSGVRSGVDSVTPPLIGDGLACLDQVVRWLDEIQASGEPPGDAQAAADRLIAQFAARSPDSGQTQPVATGSPTRPSVAQGILVAQLALLDDPAAKASRGRTASAGRVVVNLLSHAGRAAEAAQLRQVLARSDIVDDPRALRAVLQVVQESFGASGDDAGAAAREMREPAARGLRVDVARIDALVGLTGELTVAKNALAYAVAMARDIDDAGTLAGLLKDQHAVLDRLVNRLQLSVLNIRVLPLRAVFQRFPRLVREMMASLGKPARLVTEGDATEADKAIVESLFEPLLHVLRNALDHGVEPASARAAAGKPPSATIYLRAERRGDQVMIEVEDDGGGVDLARVRDVALQRGVATAQALAGMSEQALTDLIFAPGFSTAPDVNTLSGRGVGMDAVRSAVERLGGRVAVESRRGQGTTVRFLLPFTVMMSRLLTVEAGGQLFGIPMEAVMETLRVPRAAIADVGAAQAFVLRDRTIPLIDLTAELGAARAASPSEDANVVIATAAGHIGGLEVDRLGEPMEVMLRPMEGLLAGTPGVAGTTLLGDGRVLIVLDLAGLLA